MTGTDHWRAVSADILARATIVDASWPSANFQCWLADKLQETSGEICRSFIEATGYICGEIDVDDQLVTALLACLDDNTVVDTAFTTIRSIVTWGETLIPYAELAPAVERAVLDPDRHISPACLALLSHITANLSTPQRVANQLIERLTTSQEADRQVVAALAEVSSLDVKLPTTEIVTAFERYAANEFISPHDRTCMDFGRVLREINGGEALRETFTRMADSEETTERRATAYNALASVAEVWPTGIKPTADTLRVAIRDDNKRVSSPAVLGLVAIGREFPGVLHPITGWLTSRPASSEGVELRRRRYEGIALLAADGTEFKEAGYRFLRTGLLDSDTAVTEFALKATAELADPCLIPILSRLDDDVPDWSALPDYCRTKSGVEPHPAFKNSLPPTSGC